MRKKTPVGVLVIMLILEWGTPEFYKSSYPARDQIRDLWMWGNEVKGGPSRPQIDREAEGFIEEDRDYFLEPKPGYEPHSYPHPLAAGGLFDGEAELP